MRAVLYARYSTKKQREESSEDQFRVCREFAQRSGFMVVGQYDDPEVSGGTADRPRYQAMLAAARQGDFEVIVAEDLSRLWREQAEQWATIKELQDRNIHICTVSGIDSRQPNFNVIAAVFGAANELGRTDQSYRGKRGGRGNAERGTATGSCPYGYHTTIRPDGTKWLAVDEAEAEVVRRIFRMYAEGMGGKQIAVALNEDRVPSPAKQWKRKSRRTDGLWHPSAIVGDPKKFVGIINNETYAGRFIWNRTTWKRSARNSKKRWRIINPRSEWIERPAPDLRIVDDELWEAVQVRVRATQERTSKARERAAEAIATGKPRRNRTGGYASVKSARPGNPAPYLLSGLLKCGTCGSNFIMADGRKYGCATRINCGSAMCSNSIRVSRTDAEELLLASLRDELLNGEYLKLWGAEVDREVRELRAQPKPGDSVRRQLGEVEAKIGRLVDALASGLSGSEAVAAQLRVLEVEKASLGAQLEALADPTPIDVTGALRGSAEDFVRLMDELPAHLTDPAVVYEARDAVRSWVGDVRIEASEDGPLAFWRLNAEGLLLKAGPRVADVVAGAFGL